MRTMIANPWLNLPVFAPDDGGDKGADGGGDKAAADAAAAAAAAAAAGGDKGGGDKGGDKGADGKTAIEGGGDQTKPAAGDWPTDWRERSATGPDGKVDAKLLERAKRYTDPVAMARAGFEAQNRIAAGKVNDDTPMPDPAKDADGAKKWREERGIPVEVTGYTIPDEISAKMLPTDKPVMENFTTFAHGKNWPARFVAEGAEWYTGLMDAQAEQRAAADREAASNVQDDLRKEWGEDYKPNNTIAQRFAEEAIPGVPWFKARLPDDPALGKYAGMALGNITDVVKEFAGLGRLKYGDVAFAGGAAAKATESRMAELKTIMDTDIDKWNANPALRTEYGKLLEAAEKRNPRQ